MFYLSENLKKYRIIKNLTQEDIAEYLNVTPQSVSKWERGENYPDITFLPALANIFETSIDLLIGMDAIRAVLCFLYLKCGKTKKSNALAATLPHTRESREVIQPLILKGLNDDEINTNIRNILVGNSYHE